MEKITAVGLDLAKSVFQVHAIAENGDVVARRALRRSQVLEFFGKLGPCIVGMEACGSAHYWGREIEALGHTVRIMPPAYVKPYVKHNKTDAADAAGICEAVMRPTMRFVPIKSAEQQGAGMMLKTREIDGAMLHLLEPSTSDVSDKSQVATASICFVVGGTLNAVNVA